MNALNQIIVEGNVTRTPEMKELPRGSHVCLVPIAVNRRYKSSEGKDTDEVSYFDIETYGKLADACEKWCPKGRGVRVVGRLKQSRWTSTEGKPKSRITIIAEHVEFKPYFQKKEDNTEVKMEGPSSADSREPTPDKEHKLAMLAEAAAATQSEQEKGEVVF